MNIKETIKLLKAVKDDFVKSCHLYEEDNLQCNLMWEFHYGFTHSITLLEKASEYEEKQKNKPNGK